MFVDDLPMWGYIGDVVNENFLVGEVSGFSKTYLFPHLIFRFGINNSNIVSASITTDSSRKVDITNSEKSFEVTFSYAVQFYNINLEWKDRMSSYVDYRFVPDSFEIHWLSIINSFRWFYFLQHS
jgi:hypothetical protein